MANKAKEIITPNDTGVFRTVFLYVGQGDATIMAIPEGEGYKYALIDSNQDESCGGIDIQRLLKDLFAGDGEKLDLYINTHPHKDHLSKVKDIYKKVGIRQLWHSGHKPGGDHKDVYEDLEWVIKQMGDENVFCLRGTRSENEVDEKSVKLGDINYDVLAPADHVADDIEGEKPEDRYRRIHEQCGVIRFRYGQEEKQIMMTGDADYVAWKDHITDYHQNRLPSTVLSAAHHGSNSFFWENSDTKNEPYKDHLEHISPMYIVVSAPKRKESKHNHPDKEAMDLYEEEVGKEGVLHLGKNRECVIVDIKKDGNVEVRVDRDLVETYGAKDEGGGDGGNKKSGGYSKREDITVVGNGRFA